MRTDRTQRTRPAPRQGRCAVSPGLSRSQPRAEGWRLPHAGLLALCALLWGAGAAPLAQEKKASYVGADKCKVCHLPQHNVWLKTAHARALERLGEQRNNPECLACHTTGAAGGRDPSASDLSGVQCEACHGPGSLYKSPLIMSKTKYARDPAQARQAALAAGLALPEEKVCASCHNSKSPTFKGFDFASAREKIKHWD